MAMFPDHRFIQVEGCRAVEALADGDPENVQRLGEADCCRLVEKALERFPDDSNLQTQGCRAVTNLFNGEANIRELGKGRVCELIVSALRSFPQDHEVQIEACGAVANLANNSKSNRIKLGCAGACELVTKSMSMFPDNIDVQHAACVAVGNLANRHADNKRRLGAAGACNKVCAALAGFQGDLGVQYMGCGAVGNLSNSNSQNCTTLGKAGACLLVAGGMNSFPEDRNLQHVGCAAVANLAIGNAPNMGRLVKAGAKGAVQRAINFFERDAEIQTRGMQALQWLSTRPRNTTSHSMKKLTGPEVRQARARARSRDARDSSESASGRGWRGDKGKSGHARASSVPNLGERVVPRGRGRGYSTVTETDESASEGDEHDDDDYTSTAYDDEEDMTESEDDNSDEYSEDTNDDASVTSSVLNAATGAGAASSTRSRGHHSAEIKPVSPPKEPTPTIKRPLSKAEMPMGALLEDFDSDGQGSYGPGPTRASAPMVLGGGWQTGASTGTTASSRMESANEQVAGGGRVAVGPSPQGAQAPTPGVFMSGGEPAAAHHRRGSSRGSGSTTASRGSSRPSYRGSGDLSQMSRSARSAAAGGDPATKAHKSDSGRHSHAHGSDMWTAELNPDCHPGNAAAPTRIAMEQRERERERSARGGPGGGEKNAGSSHRRPGSTDSRRSAASSGRRSVGSGGLDGYGRGEQTRGRDVEEAVSLRDLEDSATAVARGAGHHRRGSSCGSRETVRSRRGSELSVGAVPVPSFAGVDDRARRAEELEAQHQSTHSRTSQRSFSSSRSSKSGRSVSSSHYPRRRHAKEFLEDPAIGSAPQVAELLREDESIALPLGIVIGRDPAKFTGMLANVEQLVQRSREMDAVTRKVRVLAMSSSDSPLGESLKRREYFNTLYAGLCGAHIAAAVVARGGIVADSKDGWLRKASALVRVVAAACPMVKPGVGLLGKALQLAERTRMADYLEQVAKASKTPSDVSELIEQTALRLVREGRAEINAAALDALQSLENPTDEWLPAWLLEESGATSGRDVGDPSGGPPGTEGARKAGTADGCAIIKAIGKRSLRNMNAPADKVEVLVKTIVKTAAASRTYSGGKPADGFADSRLAAQEVTADTMRSKRQPPSPPLHQMPPPVSPSVASTVNYPPLSPSTLPPGQGLASPSGSAIGALRRAEAKGAAGGGYGTSRAPDDSGEVDAPKAPVVIAQRPAVVATSKVVEPSGPPRVAPSAAPRGYGSRGGRGRSGDHGSTSSRKSTTAPASAVAPVSPKAVTKSAPVNRITVPDVFKQSTKAPLVDFSGGQRAPVVVANPTADTVDRRHRRRASDGRLAEEDSAVSKGLASSAGGVEEPTRRAAERDGRSAGRAPPPDQDSAPRFRSTSGERKTGPRKLKVAGRGGQAAVCATRQRAALGLDKDSLAARESDEGVRSSSKKRSPKRMGSPVDLTAAAVAARSGRRTVAAAQRSWGRSGSWYEPRRRETSQASATTTTSTNQAGPNYDGIDEDEDEDEDDSEDDEEIAGRKNSRYEGGVMGAGRSSSRERRDTRNKEQQARYAGHARSSSRAASESSLSEDAAAVRGGVASGAGAGEPANGARGAVGVSMRELDAGGSRREMPWKDRAVPGPGGAGGSPEGVSETGSSAAGRRKGGGKMTEKLAIFMRSAVSGKGGSVDSDNRSTHSGRSRSSHRRGSSYGNASSASRSRSTAPRGGCGTPQSPAGYAAAAVDAKGSGEWRRGRSVEASDRGGSGRAGRPEKDAWSPGSTRSKVSASSRLSNFLSGSSRSVRALKEAAARDTFGSSDGDASDAAEAPFGSLRIAPKVNSRSNLALPKEAYSVQNVPAEEDVDTGTENADRLGLVHGRSTSAMSVSEMIKNAEKNIEKQQKTHVRRASAGLQPRWPRPTHR